jgi:hypothetical protein
MEKLSPEMEALITSLIYLDCRLKAIVNLLGDRGISLPNEVIDAATHKLHAEEGEVKRYELFCRIKDDKFDIR